MKISNTILVPMDAPCASSERSSARLLPDEEDIVTTAHDIFLSHSGSQKGFVKGLYKMLSPLYNTFFDVERHSLPCGENFPQRILSAASRCRLAVVVLSDEFLSSRWTMIELCAFVDARSTVKILPLFYALLPDDLRDLQRWRSKWEAHAALDTRIDVSKWASAVRTLRSQNGLVFDSSEGELAYLQEIVSSISEIVPPAIKCDDSGIHGKDRLLKIILAKFESLESQQLRRDHTLPYQSKVSVLGMYGLPGSGKSTLSKCLCDHLFPHFLGRVLYLNLPTDPTPAELLSKIKELLNLTDFNDRIHLNNVSDLRQVYHLLKAYNLPTSRVLLVVDNISEECVEAVEAILQLGVGPGSKVMLVVRTLDVLRSLLDGIRGQYYNCGSIRIPSINETEAVRILLQRGDGVGLAGYAIEEDLTPGHRKIMVDVVRMCAFGPEHDLLYLPLVIKTMGVLLRKHKQDVEKWGSESRSFWDTVKEYKKNSVRKLVEKSFRGLCEELQLLFLDVALFLVPSKTTAAHEACVLLSFMHECSAERIKMQLQELERCCFLDYSQLSEITVHDVYLEFAQSIQESSRYFSSRCCSLPMNHDASAEVPMNHDASAEVPKHLSLLQDQTKCQLTRAIVLEVGEGCTRVDLQGFSGVKALAVRNSESLAVLGLVGLTSLLSLDIENCPHVELANSDQNTLCNLKRLRWVEQDWIRNERSIMQIQECKQLLCNWFRMITSSSRPPPPQRPLLGLTPTSQMKNLQVLTLEGTCITMLGSMSSCWPQLRVLEVFEDRLEAFEVGNLVRLKSFLFSDYGRDFFNQHLNQAASDRKSNPRMMQGVDLLMRCPELEEVHRTHSSTVPFDQELGTSPSNSRALCLRSFHPATKLPDLTSLARSLELQLGVYDCRKLERMNFVCQFSSLTDLSLWGCPSVVEVNELGGLPRLRSLNVTNYPNLRALRGLENLRMLVKLSVCGCSEIREISDLSGLERLEDCVVTDCPNVLVPLGALENLSRLRHLTLSSCVQILSLRNLVGLEVLQITYSGIDSGILKGLENLVKLRKLSLCNELNHESNTLLAVDFALLLGISPAAATTSSLSSLGSIRILELGNFHNLASLNGIEYFSTLERLQLLQLQNLTDLQGLESLMHLQWLQLEGCALLDGLPSLSALVNMRYLHIHNCPKLKAVKGCDAMTTLYEVSFTGCKSLTCLPFDLEHGSALRQLQSRRGVMSIKGCEFASIDAMVGWVLDEGVPVVLGEASLDALVWEYYDNLHDKPTEKTAFGVLLVETFFPRILNGLLCNDDDCLVFHDLARLFKEPWTRLVWHPIPHSVMEFLRAIASSPKKCLLQFLSTNPSFKLTIVDFLNEIGENVSRRLIEGHRLQVVEFLRRPSIH